MRRWARSEFKIREMFLSGSFLSKFAGETDLKKYFFQFKFKDLAKVAKNNREMSFILLFILVILPIILIYLVVWGLIIMASRDFENDTTEVRGKISLLTIKHNIKKYLTLKSL